MKKISISLALAALLMSALYLISPADEASSDRAKDFSALFGKEGMENGEARKAWEHKMLADPATGEIPKGIRAAELEFASTLQSNPSYKTDTINPTWDQRGPWNLGGRTRAFAMDVTNDSILLTGGVSGGIWRSTDAGGSWNKMTGPSFYPGVISIVQDRRSGEENNWYALSGEAYGTSASGGGAFFLGTGMFKSTDNGVNWSVISSTNSNTPQVFDNVWDVAWNLAMDESNTTQTEIYAALIGAVMRSTNGGSSWTRVRGSTTSGLAYFTNVMTTPNGVVYATLSSDGVDKGFWRSPDGLTWTKIDPAGMPTSWGRTVTAYNPLDENVVYFLISDTDSLSGKRTQNFRGDPEWNALWRYTFLSGNGSGSGGKWENLTQNIPATGGPFDEFNVQGGYDLVVSVNPNDTGMVIIGGTNLYRSTSRFDDSTNTTHIGGYAVGAGAPELFLGLYPNQHPDHHGVLFHPNQANVMYSVNDGGIWRTNDVTAGTVAWDDLNKGYMVTQFYTVGLDHGTSGSDVIVGGLQDNGTYWTGSSNLQDDWEWVSGGDGAYLAIEDGGAYYYFSKQLGRIAKCQVDGSGNVTAFERIDPIGAYDYDFINPFVLDPNNQDIMYLPAGRKVWVNSDLSAITLTNTWDSISTNWNTLADTVPGTGQITAIAASKTPADRIYIGTDDRLIYRYDSVNTNPTRIYISSNLMPAGAHVSCIAVDPNNGDNVIVVFSNYGVYSIWYSTNAGFSWTKSAGNLEQTISGSGNGPSVRWVQILPLSDRTVYLAGTSTGLYLADSLNGTNTVWTQMGANSIGNNVVTQIDYRESDGLTAVATHGAGMWSGTILGGPIINREPDILPNKPTVNIYPNPLQASSLISLDASEAGKVDILLYDQSGRIIQEVFRGNVTQGRTEFELEAMQLSPGIYFCELRGNGWRKVVKCIAR